MTETDQESVIHGDNPIDIDAIRARVNALVESDLLEVRDALRNITDLAVLSHTLTQLKYLDQSLLDPLRNQGRITFDFHPALEIPAYEKPLEDAIADADYFQAIRTLGTHAGEAHILKRRSVATKGQLHMNQAVGEEEFRPIVESLSEIGNAIFSLIDHFDRTGAVIAGKSNFRIAKINIQAAGGSFILVRPKAIRTDEMNEMITLPELDAWRIQRLSTDGQYLNELKVDMRPIKFLFAESIVGRIFEDNVPTDPQ